MMTGSVKERDDNRESVTSLIQAVKDENALRKEGIQRASMLLIMVLMIIAITVILAIDFSTSPPTLNPMILLMGLALALIVYVTFRQRTQYLCGACRKRIPYDAAVCPYCGHRFLKT